MAILTKQEYNKELKDHVALLYRTFPNVCDVVDEVYNYFKTERLVVEYIELNYDIPEIGLKEDIVRHACLDHVEDEIKGRRVQ